MLNRCEQSRDEFAMNTKRRTGQIETLAQGIARIGPEFERFATLFLDALLQVPMTHATERGEPTDRKPIEWKLITHLPVRSRRDAIEKLDRYAMRWKIETFHKILKSGCKAEESRLRSADRLANLISVFCILSWRIFWLTMINRCAPNAPSQVALTHAEVELLDQVVKDTARTAQAPPLSRSLIKLAQLGGYLARASDPPPGNTVIWRGLRRRVTFVN